MCIRDRIATETQLSRLLGNTPLQVELELIHTDSHESKNTSREHLLKFYQTFEDVRDRWFDGLIITGAPVEQMPFEQVEYWPELCRIMEWSRTQDVYKRQDSGLKAIKTRMSVSGSGVMVRRALLV